MSKHDWQKDADQAASAGGDPEETRGNGHDAVTDAPTDGAAQAQDSAAAQDPSDAQNPGEAQQASDPGDNPRPRTLEKALDQIDLLRDQLAAKTEEAAQHYDRLLRERAELENFKRRMQRERAEALRYACEPLLRELLGVIDNLERAVDAANKAAEGIDPSARGPVDGLVSGVQMVLQQFQEILGRSGVTRIDPQGQVFDPAVHEAVAQVESEAEPGTVVEAYMPGYRLHDRLLRPAKVAVAKTPSQH
ncbi:MAG TPA: nucleotide exchange factor GrpE [Candidatus Binatia bacterium]